MLELMKGRFFFLWLLTVLWTPTCALADGGFIPATAFAKMEIPDQRALIHFADGRETLVIDTAFRGDGTNFAWIVPVPSEPDVQAATTGLFTTLQFIFQPPVYHEFTRYFLGAIVFGGFLLSLMWSVKKGRSVLEILLLWFVGFVMYGMILSAGSNATGYPANGVEVVGRKTVGIYETVTLASRDGSALVSWLDRNGFATPTNYLPAIQAYAREGWFFVASKIRLDAPLTEPAKPHPLAFTFQTTRPVYPLRLTGLNNPHCKIELYVFGNSRAEIPNFSVDRCEQPSYPAPNLSYRGKSEELRIRHPLLRTLTANSPVATKLSGDLTSLQMKDDAYLSWTPFRVKRPILYSSDGAALLAANIAVPALVLAGLMAYAASGSLRPWAVKMRRISGTLAFAAVIAWSVVSLTVPRIPVVVAALPGLLSLSLHHNAIPWCLESDWQRLTNRPPSNARPEIAWVRKELAGPLVDENGFHARLTNFFLGQPLREEDSPGNFTLRETADGIDYVWYDVDGGENVEPLFRPAHNR